MIKSISRQELQEAIADGNVTVIETLREGRDAAATPHHHDQETHLGPYAEAAE